MKTLCAFLLGTALISFIGCVPFKVFERGMAGSNLNLKDPDSADSVFAATVVEHDNFKGITKIQAPSIYLNEADSRIMYRGWSNGREAWFQLYVDHLSLTREGFNDFHEAFDDTGSKLELTGIDRTYEAGFIHEEVGVGLSPEKLRISASTPLLVRLYGRRGNCDLRVPTFYAKGFLQKARDSGILIEK